MFSIRPFDFSERDYAAYTECWNRNFPDVLESVASIRHSDKAREPERFYERALAELEGEVIGYVVHHEVWWQQDPDKYMCEVAVMPEEQGKGYGRQLFDHGLQELAKRSPHLITTCTSDDQARAIRFLEERNFRLVLREPASRLELESFDADRFAVLQEKVAAEGIVIRPLSELQETTPDWAHRLWELRWLILRDVPTTGTWKRDTFEEYERETLQHPDFTPAYNFIAFRDDRWIGLSNLWKTDADPEKVWCSLTGVDREFRRKGIATVLKARAAEYAREAGFKRIDTDNEENNPMYQLNQQLGFKPLPAWLEYELKVKSD